MRPNEMISPPFVVVVVIAVAGLVWFGSIVRVERRDGNGGPGKKATPIGNAYSAVLMNANSQRAQSKSCARYLGAGSSTFGVITSPEAAGPNSFFSFYFSFSLAAAAAADRCRCLSDERVQKSPSYRQRAAKGTQKHDEANRCQQRKTIERACGFNSFIRNLETFHFDLTAVAVVAAQQCNQISAQCCPVRRPRTIRRPADGQHHFE